MNCRYCGRSDGHEAYCENVRKAVAAERERCAKIAEDHMKAYAGHHGCCGPADAAQGIASDIRKSPLVL